MDQKALPVPRCDKCGEPMRALESALVSWQGRVFLARKRKCLVCGQRVRHTLQVFRAPEAVNTDNLVVIDRKDGGANLLRVTYALGGSR